MMKRTYVCCICGREHEGWGNNPWPVNKDPDARCCDDCNVYTVVPARLWEIYKERKPQEVKK